MTLNVKINNRVRMLLNTLGMSCLGGSVFLQILVFTDILQHGFFIAVEKNLAILTLEVALTIFTLIYFVIKYLRFLISIK